MTILITINDRKFSMYKLQSIRTSIFLQVIKEGEDNNSHIIINPHYYQSYYDIIVQSQKHIFNEQ